MDMSEPLMNEKIDLQHAVISSNLNASSVEMYLAEECFRLSVAQNFSSLSRFDKQSGIFVGMQRAMLRGFKKISDKQR